MVGGVAVPALLSLACHWMVFPVAAFTKLVSSIGATMAFKHLSAIVPVTVGFASGAVTSIFISTLGLSHVPMAWLTEMVVMPSAVVTGSVG